ncbi:methionine ABC transporter ATP-binding protein [Cellulomonas carbonis]|uniref:ABC transporter n=1 Tax=Cellulomonas carbonis T26 TaxID=947969 RepID=A0A0A0BSX5_9CELL|nr:ATP-binding cassette domain-containing protein [Cellulomonas carbonis]KGM11040.1 ABC transporter [Cellulomonas carbonis T26]GGB99542.1 methionine ABC transporter ATP-binding protein [Cellulomonas carbonis]
MIELSDLRKVYPGPAGDVVALDGIDLVVERGAVHGVVGRSGAGKSTLIRCLTGLERPTSGRVVVDGTDISALPEQRLRAARRRMGMVFQHVNLLDSRTVAANVAFPLEVAGTPRAERSGRVRELLELVGLGDKAGAYPAQLSGGQRQRVGIARALATEPAVLLCDEPTSALDSATTRQTLGLIRDLRDRLGITVVIITHEMAVVREICDSVTLLEHGRVVQDGSLAEVVTDHGSRLARELIPVPDLPLGPSRALVEVTYATDEVSTHDALAAVAALGRDVEVVAGTIETLAGLRVGRLQLEVPAAHVDDVIARLTADRLHAAPTVAGDPTDRTDPADPRGATGEVAA